MLEGYKSGIVKALHVGGRILDYSLTAGPIVVAVVLYCLDPKPEKALPLFGIAVAGAAIDRLVFSPLTCRRVS
jgi:hypothetical protein